MSKNNLENSHQRLRLGVVGGGQGAFIGAVHRIAARLDDCYEIVAGALSPDHTRALNSGRSIGLDEDRIYSDYLEMAQKEAQRPDGIEVVSIATPNHLHIPVSRAFMERGIHVICDKPLSTDPLEAKEFAEFAKTVPARFFLTHNYSAYPMVRQMRDIVASGELGRLRVINMEYLQGWLANDEIDNKQSRWRADPAQAGIGGALGDIGTHAYHLATFVTRCKATQLSADIQCFGAGRVLDDNAHINFRFDNSIRGSAWISQVAVGQAYGLKLRVVGSDGMVEFNQEDPEKLMFWKRDEPLRVFTRGGPMGSTEGRVPEGHPEGYLEAFATLYRNIADILQGRKIDETLVPDLGDGLEGMAFIAASVASSKENASWKNLEEFRFKQS